MGLTPAANPKKWRKAIDSRHTRATRIPRHLGSGIHGTKGTRNTTGLSFHGDKRGTAATPTDAGSARVAACRLAGGADQRPAVLDVLGHSCRASCGRGSGCSHAEFEFAACDSTA